MEEGKEDFVKNLIDKKKRDTSKMMKCVVIYRRYKIVCNMRIFKYSLSWETNSRGLIITALST